MLEDFIVETKEFQLKDLLRKDTRVDLQADIRSDGHQRREARSRGRRVFRQPRRRGPDEEADAGQAPCNRRQSEERG